MSASPSWTLSPSPPDAVSKVAFSPDSKTLLVSTWAGTTSLHTAASGLLSAEAPDLPHALLDAAWHPNRPILFSASLDGALRTASISESRVQGWKTIGTHSPAAASCLVAFDDVLVSAGWDSRIKVWDVREGSLVSDVQLGGRAYSAVRCGERRVAIISSDGRLRGVDVRMMDKFFMDRVPGSLTGQLRGLSVSADGKQVVVGSTEGRVAVDWIDCEGREAFSFKCHRVDGMAFPVNCIVHSDLYGSFVTGGADGHVSFWDGGARKRIAQYERYPTSVASLDFDTKSEKIAVAVSYTFEEGEKDHPPDEVHICTIDPLHVATRSAPDAAQGVIENKADDPQ